MGLKVNIANWDAMYKRLVVYKTKHGDTVVPNRYKKDPKLVNWVNRQQRRAYIDPEKSKKRITEEHKRVS